MNFVIEKIIATPKCSGTIALLLSRIPLLVNGKIYIKSDQLSESHVLDCMRDFYRNYKLIFQSCILENNSYTICADLFEDHTQNSLITHLTISLVRYHGN